MRTPLFSLAHAVGFMFEDGIHPVPDPHVGMPQVGWGREIKRDTTMSLLVGGWMGGVGWGCHHHDNHRLEQQ